MASDLLDDPVLKQLAESRDRFSKRIADGVKLRSSKASRKELYKKWRIELGDDVARESAKYVEALLDGKVGWPKWNKYNP
jgi:hypothetical protein